MLPCIFHSIDHKNAKNTQGALSANILFLFYFSNQRKCYWDIGITLQMRAEYKTDNITIFIFLENPGTFYFSQ